MRPLIYLVAASVDGFIAHEDGSFDGFPWSDEYIADLVATFPETIPVHVRGEADRPDNEWFDAVVMGRETYQVGLREGISSPYPTLDQYVFSTTMSVSPHPDVHVSGEAPEKVVRELKTQPGKAIWLCGGARLAGTLLEAGLIDEVVVKLNPVLFGRGIPLFRDSAGTLQLTLKDSKVHPSGHMRLRYGLTA